MGMNLKCFKLSNFKCFGRFLELSWCSLEKKKKKKVQTDIESSVLFSGQN